MGGFSYKRFTFKVSIGKADEIEEMIGPMDEGISEDEWYAMTEEDREGWLNEALAEWSLNYLQTSWN